MSNDLRRDVRWLKAYVLGATGLCHVAVTTAFTQFAVQTRFTELDIERPGDGGAQLGRPDRAQTFGLATP